MAGASSWRTNSVVESHTEVWFTGQRVFWAMERRDCSVVARERFRVKGFGSWFAGLVMGAWLFGTLLSGVLLLFWSLLAALFSWQGQPPVVATLMLAHCLVLYWLANPRRTWTDFRCRRRLLGTRELALDFELGRLVAVERFDHEPSQDRIDAVDLRRGTVVRMQRASYMDDGFVPARLELLLCWPVGAPAWVDTLLRETPVFSVSYDENVPADLERARVRVDEVEHRLRAALAHGACGKRPVEAVNRPELERDPAGGWRLRRKD